MKLHKGFTLIELVVVMAVFLFITGAALGIFISIIQGQKRVLSEEEILNQVSYIEEYMSKSLRMAATEQDTGCLLDSQETQHNGYIYMLTHRQGTMYEGIEFINHTDGDICWRFYLDNSVPGDTTKPLVLWEKEGASPAVALTPATIQINSINFAVNGAVDCGALPLCGASDNDPNNASVQPRVTILLNITIPGASVIGARTCQSNANCPAGEACDQTVKKCVQTTTIQTTVSRRTLNIFNPQ